MPFILLKPNFRMTPVLADPNSTIQCGGAMHNCEIRLITATPVDCPCSGSMCDWQQFGTGYGRTPTTMCSCVRGDNMGKTTGLSLNVKIINRFHSTEISAEGFISKWFHENIITTGGVARLTPAHFQKNMRNVERKIHRIFNYLQTVGGMSVYGWQKTSLVDDQGAQAQQQQANGANNANQVLQSHANFHIVRCEPSDPERVDRAILDRLKIDLSSL